MFEAPTVRRLLPALPALLLLPPPPARVLPPRLVLPLANELDAAVRALFAGRLLVLSVIGSPPPTGVMPSTDGPPKLPRPDRRPEVAATPPAALEVGLSASLRPICASPASPVAAGSNSI